jgi:hypothetical protein
MIHHMHKNKVFLNRDDIIEVKVIGNQTSDTIIDMAHQIDELLGELNAQNKLGLVLDDVSELGKTDTAARQALRDVARQLPYDKVAMFGNVNPIMRTGTTLLLQAIGMGQKIKYFEDRDQAISWLKS